MFFRNANLQLACLQLDGIFFNLCTWYLWVSLQESSSYPSPKRDRVKMCLALVTWYIHLISDAWKFMLKKINKLPVWSMGFIYKISLWNGIRGILLEISETIHISISALMPCRPMRRFKKHLYLSSSSIILEFLNLRNWKLCFYTIWNITVLACAYLTVRSFTR